MENEESLSEPWVDLQPWRKPRAQSWGNLQEIRDPWKTACELVREKQTMWVFQSKDLRPSRGKIPSGGRVEDYRGKKALYRKRPILIRRNNASERKTAFLVERGGCQILEDTKREKG